MSGYSRLHRWLLKSKGSTEKSHLLADEAEMVASPSIGITTKKDRLLQSMRSSSTATLDTSHHHHHHHHGRSREGFSEHQSRQAMYVTTILAVGAISLFTLAPRLALARPDTNAFDDKSLMWLWIIQETSSLFYIILYYGGWQWLKKARARKLRKYLLIHGDNSISSVGAFRWRAMSLDHPLNVIVQMGFAGILPLISDILSECFKNRYTFIANQLRWLGALRLLMIWLFQPAFSVLDTNLNVPHAVTPIIRTSVILIFFTHYAACTLWLLARWREFSAQTWVGDQAPWLTTAAVPTQYIWSLYFSVITISTVGYGDYHAVNTAEAFIVAFYVLSSIWLIANIVGVLSALAALADTDMAEQRAKIARFERMLDSEHITPDVATATREYLRLALRASTVDVDTLPASVRLRIRRQRFGPILSALSLFNDTSDRFLKQCVALVKEDSFVKGLDVVKAGDLQSRLYVILEGHASLHLEPGNGLWKQTSLSSNNRRQSSTYQNDASVNQNDGEESDSSSSSSSDDDDDEMTNSAVLIMHPGACFGAPGFVSLVQQPYTIRARTLLRVISLDEADRRELERNNPNDWSRLRKNVIAVAKEIAEHAESLSKQITNGTAAMQSRIRLPKLHMSLERPTNVSRDKVIALVREVRAVIQAIQSDITTASHALSALYCHIAAIGDVVELRRLLDLVKGSQDLNKEIPGDYDGRTSIHLAAANGRIECCRLLLDRGAAVNVQDRFGRTPLHEAVLGGHDQVISLLVSNGAQLILPEHAVASCLCEAVVTSDQPLITRYLDAGANVSATDYDNRTALHLAASEGNLPLCRQLLSRNADPKVTDRWGHTPADEAAQFGHTGAIFELLKCAAASSVSDRERKWTATRGTAFSSKTLK
mmetsp:Transcript_5480/g.8080  ORF Transcript_5480/g.8080 Transcript_5480/m.8080 type:complete len:883 (-) Transcript_5480:608-3256(-)